MRGLLTFGCVISLVAVAACNRGGEAPPPDTQAEPARNVAAGEGSVGDMAQVMQARRDHYEQMGKAMKGMGDQLKSRSPSVETIQRHADLIAVYGPQLLSWFPEGSGPETGRRTRAKAEVWGDAAAFRERAEAFEAQAARFNAVAQTGDIDAIRASMRDLGTACKNCHDRFRAPED